MKNISKFIKLNYEFINQTYHYRGNVLLIVNVATFWATASRNYKILNDLHAKYDNLGLKIVAFPCNQFNGHIPQSDEDIKMFAESVEAKFDFYSTIKVNGDQAHPIYRFLKQQKSGLFGLIKWNFEKFLVDRSGKTVGRFGTFPIRRVS